MRWAETWLRYRQKGRVKRRQNSLHVYPRLNHVRIGWVKIGLVARQWSRDWDGKESVRQRSWGLDFMSVLNQKPYKFLKFFLISVILFKMGKHSDFYLRFFQIIGAWRDFTVVIKLIENFKSLYGLGERCLKIREIMDFEPYFKVHNLVSTHFKSTILSQMTNLNMIFHVKVSVYRLIKIWNSQQFPAEFRNGQWTSNFSKSLFCLSFHYSPYVRHARTISACQKNAVSLMWFFTGA